MLGEYLDWQHIIQYNALFHIKRHRICRTAHAALLDSAPMGCGVQHIKEPEAIQQGESQPVKSDSSKQERE